MLGVVQSFACVPVVWTYGFSGTETSWWCLVGWRWGCLQSMRSDGFTAKLVTIQLDQRHESMSRIIVTIQCNESMLQIIITIQYNESISRITVTIQCNESMLWISVTSQCRGSSSWFNVMIRCCGSASRFNITYQCHESTSHINFTDQFHDSMSHTNVTDQCHRSISWLNVTSRSHRSTCMSWVDGTDKFWRSMADISLTVSSIKLYEMSPPCSAAVFHQRWHTFSSFKRNVTFLTI